MPSIRSRKSQQFQDNITKNRGQVVEEKTAVVSIISIHHI
jgi:hypothetical protein